MEAPDQYATITLAVVGALDFERALTEAGMPSGLRWRIIHDPAFARFAVGKLSEAADIEQILGNSSIIDLGLRVLTVNALRRSSIMSVFDLLQYTRAGLQEIWHVSPHAVDEIEAALTARGLSLKK